MAYSMLCSNEGMRRLHKSSYVEGDRKLWGERKGYMGWTYHRVYVWVKTINGVDILIGIQIEY